MKEELINKALEYLNAIELFAAEQVPIFIEELLNYYTALYISGIVGLILMFAASLKLWKLSNKESNDESNHHSGEGYYVVSIVIGVTALILLIPLTIGFLKLIMAPRLFLIHALQCYI